MSDSGNLSVLSTVIGITGRNSLIRRGQLYLWLCPPLQTCQMSYDRASTPWHTPHPLRQYSIACPE